MDARVRARLHWCGLVCVVWAFVSAPVALADDEQRVKLSPAAERVRAWFPEDTETLMAALSFRLAKEEREQPKGENSAFFRMVTDFTSFAQLLACGELASLEDGHYPRVLGDKKVAVAMSGGRHFEVVSAFGSHRSEGCAVLVFEEELGDVGKAWLDQLRQGAKEVRTVRGREVFVFPPTTKMESFVKLKPWQGTYLVLLTPETVLCASSDVYLEEVLTRVGTQPAGRALPDSLAEWKHIDFSAPAWMLRRIPLEKEQRIIEGFTWSMKKDRVVIDYLPVANAVQNVEMKARELWQPERMDLKAEFSHAADGTVIVSLKTERSDQNVLLTGLFLYTLQAESGAVGKQ